MYAGRGKEKKKVRKVALFLESIKCEDGRYRRWSEVK